MDTSKVARIIVSLNGGFNGEASTQQIQCHIREDGLIVYDLADWNQEEQAATGRVEHYEVSIVSTGVTEAPIPPEEPERDAQEALEAEQSAQEE